MSPPVDTESVTLFYVFGIPWSQFFFIIPELYIKYIFLTVDCLSFRPENRVLPILQNQTGWN